ncbi:MAG: nucleotidyltransferase family protein [Oscillospiraceae bacterium]|nr:nucleotidyltransferase family protein [Oscillospiraceae bacterium]
MTTEQTYIIMLLRAAFGQTAAPTAPEHLDEAAAERMIRNNGILLTVYASLTSALRDKLRIDCLSMASQQVQQGYEGKQIMTALRAAGLDCIGLKGWETRKLYPQETMRQMADLDILVRPYHFKQIADIMRGLKFTVGDESSWKHDNFAKGCITVEMHKRLTDDSDQVREWERHVWDRVIRDGDGLRMSMEDQMIFHIVHMQKDFMNGSLGLRRIVDTWLLQRQEFDHDWVRQEMERMGLASFYEHMLRLSRQCMGETELDEDGEFLLDHAFRYGIYGSQKTYQMGRIVRMSGGSLMSGKIRSAAAAVFLPRPRMKAHFPTLERYPVLLPYFWGKRIARFLKGDVRQLRQRLDYSDLTEEDYREMQRFSRAGGC